MYAFVDGAVDINRRRDQGGAGFGGAGVVLVAMNAEAVISYRVIGVPFWPHSIFISNNTMEVMAVQVACNVLQEEIDAGADTHIWTDSSYAVGSLSFGSSWMPKKNVTLIDSVRRSTARANVHFHHCRGHKGFAWNELSNLAAQKAVEKRKGFDATYECSISELCFSCKKFPCGKTDSKRFGLKVAVLTEPQGYAGILECEDFERGEVGGFEP